MDQDNHNVSPTGLSAGPASALPQPPATTDSRPDWQREALVNVNAEPLPSLQPIASAAQPATPPAYTPSVSAWPQTTGQVSQPEPAPASAPADAWSQPALPPIDPLAALAAQPPEPADPLIAPAAQPPAVDPWTPSPASTMVPSPAPSPIYDNLPPAISDELPDDFDMDDEAETRPLAVVQVVSPRGVEYAMMTIALWIGTFSLLGLLLSLINSGHSFSVLAVPISSLIVCLPVFSYFFLRLKKLEIARPELKLDPSKRRFTQFTQITSFIICLLTLISFVSFVMLKIGGQAPTSLLKAILDVIVVLAVTGGILRYYWLDEHKTKAK